MTDDRQNRSVSTTAAVIGLIAFLLTVVVILGCFLVWRDYTETLARAETQVSNTADTASEHVRWLIEANLQALQRIDQALEGSIAIFSRTEAQELSDAVAALPGEPDLWVINSDLRPVLSTNLKAEWGDVAGDESLEAIRNGSEWTVSRLIIGKVTGRRFFIISRRIERDDRFLGAVVVAVPGNLLSQFWLSLGSGEGSTVGLVRNDGGMVARYPVPDQPLDLSEHGLFTDYLKRSSEGLYRGTSPLDGIERVIGYHRVPGLPLVMVAGASLESALEPFWYRLRLLLIFGVPLIVAFIATVVWITVLLRRDERHQIELAATLEQNQMLLREVHHRVKNNLQVVASLVNLQGGPPEMRQELIRRIGAIAAVHEQIYLADQFAQIDLAHYLGSIVQSLKETYGVEAEIELDLQPTTVEINTALPLALIVSEITSNAFKHAFRDGKEGGRLSLRLRHDDDGRGELRIADNGEGFDMAARRSGLGLRLVDGFCRQIGAECAYSYDGGVVFDLRFPIEREQVPEPIFTGRNLRATSG